MVRGERIKIDKIPGFTVNAVNKGYFTDNVNGELLKVQVLSAGTAGSIIVFESGANTPFGTFSIGSQIAPQGFTFTGSEYSVDRIGVTGSLLTSGTGNTVGDITIFSR